MLSNIFFTAKRGLNMLLNSASRTRSDRGVAVWAFPLAGNSWLSAIWNSSLNIKSASLRPYHLEAKSCEVCVCVYGLKLHFHWTFPVCVRQVPSAFSSTWTYPISYLPQVQGFNGPTDLPICTWPHQTLWPIAALFPQFALPGSTSPLLGSLLSPPHTFIIAP